MSEQKSPSTTLSGGNIHVSSSTSSDCSSNTSSSKAIRPTSLLPPKSGGGGRFGSPRLSDASGTSNTSNELTCPPPPELSISPADSSGLSRASSSSANDYAINQSNTTTYCPGENMIPCEANNHHHNVLVDVTNSVRRKESTNSHNSNNNTNNNSNNNNSHHQGNHYVTRSPTSLSVNYLAVGNNKRTSSQTTNTGPTFGIIGPSGTTTMIMASSPSNNSIHGSVASSINDITYETEQLERAIRQNDARYVKKMLQLFSKYRDYDRMSNDSKSIHDVSNFLFSPFFFSLSFPSPPLLHSFAAIICTLLVIDQTRNKQQKVTNINYTHYHYCLAFFRK